MFFFQDDFNARLFSLEEVKTWSSLNENWEFFPQKLSLIINCQLISIFDKLNPCRSSPFKFIHETIVFKWELAMQGGATFHKLRNHDIPYCPRKPLVLLQYSFPFHREVYLEAWSWKYAIIILFIIFSNYGAHGKTYRNTMKNFQKDQTNTLYTKLEQNLALKTSFLLWERLKKLSCWFSDNSLETHSKASRSQLLFVWHYGNPSLPTFFVK